MADHYNNHPNQQYAGDGFAGNYAAHGNPTTGGYGHDNQVYTNPAHPPNGVADTDFYLHHPDHVPQGAHNPYAEAYPSQSPYAYPNSSDEKHSNPTELPVFGSETSSDYADIDPNSGVKRGLKTRHLSMMALAGIIGPGLLIGAGGALAKGGPASLIIGFGVIGIVAFSIMQSLGELTTLYPTGGAFTGLADRFVDKAFGVSLGWNYFIIWFCVLANEYNVLTSIFSVWTDKVPQWGFFLIFWVSRRKASAASGAAWGQGEEEVAGSTEQSTDVAWHHRSAAWWPASPPWYTPWPAPPPC